MAICHTCLGMKRVTFTAASLKQFSKVQPAKRAAISLKLNRYASSGAGDIKALSGVAAKRLRVGDYRVIFTETKTDIEVIAVAHRKDVYRP